MPTMAPSLAAGWIWGAAGVIVWREIDISAERLSGREGLGGRMDSSTRRIKVGSMIYVLAGNEREFRQFLIHSGLPRDSVRGVWSIDDLQGTELGSKCYIYGTFWLNRNADALYAAARSREFDFINV